MNTEAKYFMLILLFLLFLLLYIYVANVKICMNPKSKETFECKSQSSYILPKDKLAIVQGNAVPTMDNVPIKFDNDPSAPSIDGKKGPNQMFMFAFNKAAPECCPSPFSTSQGCVCMTTDQVNFIGSRGFNSKYDKCSNNEF
jgi:hypothetical protein